MGEGVEKEKSRVEWKREKLYVFLEGEIEGKKI